MSRQPLTPARGAAASAPRLRGLYAVTPDVDDTDRARRARRRAIAGGATAIQYRNKTAAAALGARRPRAGARVHAARGALFIVNDDAALARDVGADGVHLGEDDGDVAAARARVGPTRIVGVSCYDDLARAERPSPRAPTTSRSAASSRRR